MRRSSCGDGEDQIGGGRAFRQSAFQPESDDLGNQHGDRLTQHGRLGFDPADSPAQHAETVDHGGVGIGADQGIGICLRQLIGAGARVFVRAEHHPRQILQVDLVYDAGVGGHHPEVLECALTPAEELVALPIALVVEINVGSKRLGGAEGVHLHRVVHHQLDRLQRIDAARIASQGRHGVPHGGEVHHRRDAGKVLQQHPRRREGDFPGRAARGPAGQRLDVIGGDDDAVLGAKQIFEEDSQGIRQAGHVDTGAGQGREPEDLEGSAADLQGGSGVESCWSCRKVKGRRTGGQAVGCGEARIVRTTKFAVGWSPAPHLSACPPCPTARPYRDRQWTIARDSAYSVWRSDVRGILSPTNR